jgi:hypothetical protein
VKDCSPWSPRFLFHSFSCYRLQKFQREARMGDFMVQARMLMLRAHEQVCLREHVCKFCWC